MARLGYVINAQVRLGQDKFGRRERSAPKTILKVFIITRCGGMQKVSSWPVSRI